MEFYEVIKRRRTVRDFENVKIDERTLNRILEAGFMAPTNDHLRDWHYIVINDKNVVNKLLEIVPKEISDVEMDALIREWNLNDPLQQECYRNAVPKQYQMLADASVVIIPLLKQKTNVLKPENLSHLNGFASIWCSIENIFLAATAEGYACTLRVPLGDEGNWSRKVLGYPDDYLMPCFIGLGKPSRDAPSVKQKEISLEERVHWNRW